MDIQDNNQQPMSDDQELARVLAGVTGQNSDMTQIPVSVLTKPEENNDDDQPVIGYNPPSNNDSEKEEPKMSEEKPITVSGDGNLDDIRKDALVELRPLIDKLEIEPEEKFDTCLLLIRSTDDKSLIATAHEAAKNIEDESKRAQALLDIIKEIDYLSTPQ